MLVFNQKHSFSELWKFKKNIYDIILNYKKTLNFLIIKSNIIFKKTRLKGMPVFLQIEPSSICNYYCPMCPRQSIQIKREKELLSYELFHKLLQETGDNLIFLALWNYGEPFLNPDLFKMIKLAKKYHIITGISSNGSMLNENIINELLDSGIDYLIFSIDGADKNTYEQYRKGGDFNKVIMNIKKLVTQKIKFKKPLPFINLQCLLLKNTIKEMESFIALGNKIGVDKVSFKKLHFRHLINKDLLPEGEMFSRQKETDRFCSRPYLGAVVLSDGNILPCCNDLSSKYIMGNISKNSFSSIWNSNYFVSFRDNMLKNFSKIDICKDCYSSSFKESFHSVSKNVL